MASKKQISINDDEIDIRQLLKKWWSFRKKIIVNGNKYDATHLLTQLSSDSNANPLKNYTKKAFPNLTYSSTQEWIGFRPATPDSTPLIGQVAQSGVFTGFGHQHIGLTAGPKTGSLLAQLITGQIPSMDMSPYTPERYLVSW